jgi:hypothetical protein
MPDGKWNTTASGHNLTDGTLVMLTFTQARSLSGGYQMSGTYHKNSTQELDR